MIDEEEEEEGFLAGDDDDDVKSFDAVAAPVKVIEKKARCLGPMTVPFAGNGLTIVGEFDWILTRRCCDSVAHGYFY